MICKMCLSCMYVYIYILYIFIYSMYDFENRSPGSLSTWHYSMRTRCPFQWCDSPPQGMNENHPTSEKKHVLSTMRTENHDEWDWYHLWNPINPSSPKIKDDKMKLKSKEQSLDHLEPVPKIPNLPSWSASHLLHFNDPLRSPVNLSVLRASCLHVVQVGKARARGPSEFFLFRSL